MSKQNQLIFQGGAILAIVGVLILFSPVILSIQSEAIKFLSGWGGGIFAVIGTIMIIAAKIKQGAEKYNDQ